MEFQHLFLIVQSFVVWKKKNYLRLHCEKKSGNSTFLGIQRNKNEIMIKTTVPNVFGVTDHENRHEICFVCFGSRYVAKNGIPVFFCL